MKPTKIESKIFYYEKRCTEKHEIGSQHYHDHFEIYFLEKGSCRYFIDNDTYDIEKGDIVLIPAGTIHKTTYNENESIRHLIYCSSAYIPVSVVRYFPSILYVYRNKKTYARIKEIFYEIEKENISPDEFSNDVLLHYVHLLFFLLARNNDSETPARTGSTYTTKTIAYIKENYHQDIKLTDLASRLFVSCEHLSRVFKRNTGLCISEYITIIRLQQAQALLRSSPNMDVTEIAQKCGFNDSNYFSKKFKTAYGISPLAFRKKAIKTQTTAL
ncbi:MAG: helix-turn-helix domain-containing protein [Clostridiales bacterium]|nr:helix-turn-helix domain-containing protein [Clostridiales bacterium]